MSKEEKGRDVSNVDVFGVALNEEGMEVPQSDQSETEEKKEDKGDDIANNPLVVELQTKIKEYGENLSGMRQSYEGKITELNKQLADALAGKKSEEKGEDGETPLFKEVKFSKDLSEEERDDMTDTEIKLFDENARNQVAMNKMFETIQGLGKKTEEAKIKDLNSFAKTEAGALAEVALEENPDLAKDVKELTDKIIVEFNEFNNQDITPEVLKSRMKKALNNVEGYTPPKEQESKKGGNNNAVKNTAGSSSSAKIDKIIAEANKENDGNYSL